jgi:hypothetical protein
MMLNMADDVVESLREVAVRWDLQAIRRELTDAIDQSQQATQPYVATNLIRALDMFIDSYG